jgi:hypothetical protein
MSISKVNPEDSKRDETGEKELAKLAEILRNEGFILSPTPMCDIFRDGFGEAKSGAI